MRSHAAYQKTFQVLKWRLFADVFGAFVLIGGAALALLIFVIAAQRVDIALSERANRYCTFTDPSALADQLTLAEHARAALKENAPKGPHPIGKPFKTNDKCFATGFRVAKGQRYVVTMRVTESWIDRRIPTSPIGFETSRHEWYMRPSVLLRRSLTGRWFQPMLKIVPASGRGGHIEMLDMRCNCSQGPIYSAEFEAQRTGEVLLFVNDVMPLIWPELIPEKAAETRDVYQNNRGEAEVTIAPVPTYPPSPPAPP